MDTTMMMNRFIRWNDSLTPAAWVATAIGFGLAVSGVLLAVLAVAS